MFEAWSQQSKVEDWILGSWHRRQSLFPHKVLQKLSASNKQIREPELSDPLQTEKQKHSTRIC